jgi:AcrR family transcriptional regulator
VDPDQLLDAAQAVFAEAGLRAASLRAIARKAGCDPALIYYHFQGKEAMFEALLDRTLGPVVTELAALGDPGDPRTVAERFWSVICIYHAHLGENAGLRGLVRGEIVRGGEGIRESIARRVLPALEAIGRLTRLGIERGEIRQDTSPQFTTFFMIRMELEILDLIPLMAKHVSGMPGDQAVAAAERAWFLLFWRGIATRPDEPLPFLSGIGPAHP